MEPTKKNAVILGLVAVIIVVGAVILIFTPKN